jgi:hypothetical protein
VLLTQNDTDTEIGATALPALETLSSLMSLPAQADPNGSRDGQFDL